MLLFLAMRFADQLPPPAAALVGPGPPFARHGSAIDAHAPVLVLDDRGLRLDGRPVTSEADVGRNELDLDGALRSLARSWSILHPRERYPGRVLLDVPRRTPWRLVRTVTLAAARAAHPHIAFVVESPPREPALDWSHLVGR